MASTESSLDTPFLPNEEQELQRDVDVRRWMTEAKGRPLTFFVAGRGEVGKSALINNLLGLDKNDENAATEADGLTGIMTTETVTKHALHKYGIDVIAFDTPGFQDPNIEDAEIFAQLVQKTGSHVDVFLYCASLRKRVSREDHRICKLLKMAFTQSIWEKAIFVLTLANDEKVRRLSADQYQQLIFNFKKELQQSVRMAGVCEETIAAIPVHPAGYTDEKLPHSQKSEGSWQDRLYTEIINRADPTIVPALLQLRWGSNALQSVHNMMRHAVAIKKDVGVMLGSAAIAGVATLSAPVVLLEPAYAAAYAIWSDDVRTIIKAKYKLWKKGPAVEEEREKQEQEQRWCALI